MIGKDIINFRVNPYGVNDATATPAAALNVI